MVVIARTHTLDGGDGSSLAKRKDRPVSNAAELLMVDGETVASAVMDRPKDRTVIHAGRVVADGLKRT